MTKITKMIYPKITRYGFCNKGNVVFRLSEDIVQGFEIKHKHKMVPLSRPRKEKNA